MIPFLIVLFLMSFSSPGLTGAEDVVPTSQQQLQLSFAPVVKKVVPAVVNIYTQKKVQSGFRSPLMNDPLFRHFFGDQMPKIAPRSRMQKSLGSGVIMHKAGWIVTNLHVIKNATEIKVILTDNREFEAEVKMRDKRLDLALLKIKSAEEDFPFLEIHDTDDLQVGDIVLAIGNPFGIGQTVTSGIISALARTQIGAQDYRSFIQTDAAINPGNSGGALVTLDGKLAGINTAILSKSGESIGIGFAIPSNLVAPLVSSVKHGGKVIRPWVGLSLQTVDFEMSKALNMDVPKGVIIKGIYPESPGDKAGFKVGDIILSIDGHDIKNRSSYNFRIAVLNVDQTVTFNIRRNGNEETLSATLKEPPASNNKPIRLTGRHPLSGAILAEMSPALATETGMNFMEKGVVILAIQKNSTAHSFGFLPGDMITLVNNKAVETLKSLTLTLLRSRQVWDLEIKRGKRRFSIKLRR